jgi:hypothetical protein
MHNLLQYSYYYTRSGYVMEDGGFSTEVFQRKKRLKRWCINQSFQIAMYLINKIRAILAMEVCEVEAYILCLFSDNSVDFVHYRIIPYEHKELYHNFYHSA